LKNSVNFYAINHSGAGTENSLGNLAVVGKKIAREYFLILKCTGFSRESKFTGITKITNREHIKFSSQSDNSVTHKKRSFTAMRTTSTLCHTLTETSA